MNIDYYRLAPTFLFKPNGETKLFETQEAVDRAWDEGWFGPSWLVTKTPLLSGHKFETKAELRDAVIRDPRYNGLVINVKRTTEDLMDAIREFEEEHDLKEYVK